MIWKMIFLFKSDAILLEWSDRLNITHSNVAMKNQYIGCLGCGSKG